MSRQYSLAHLTVLTCPPQELIYLAARAGYDFVGLRTISMHNPGEPDHALATNPALLRRTRTALAWTGIGVHDVELCRIHPGLDPRELLPEFEVAAELGAAHAVSSIWTADRARYLELFDQVCALAVPYGITINLEYVPIAQVSTLAAAVDVLTSVDATNVGLLLDLYHVHRARTRPEDLDDLPRDWFHFFQLCDAPAHIPDSLADLRDELRERRLYVGEGGIDICATLRRLPEMVCAIELPNVERAAEYGNAEHAARCLESARAYFAGHPRPVGI